MSKVTTSGKGAVYDHVALGLKLRTIELHSVVKHRWESPLVSFVRRAERVGIGDHVMHRGKEWIVKNVWRD